MKIAYAAALALFSTVAVAAQAPGTQPGSPNVAAVTGGQYVVDPAHTLVVWTLDHMGITPYSGMFGDITGSMTLDPANPDAASVDITIPISKLVTATGGMKDHLLRPGKDGGEPDFFGADPADARFVSTSVDADGTTAKVTGNLTLNGITRPVTLDTTFYGAGKMPAGMGGAEAVGFRANTSIMRSEFGLGMAVPMVSDKVDLQIEAAFEAKPAQ